MYNYASFYFTHRRGADAPVTNSNKPVKNICLCVFYDTTQFRAQNLLCFGCMLCYKRDSLG